MIAVAQAGQAVRAAVAQPSLRDLDIDVFPSPQSRMAALTQGEVREWISLLKKGRTRPNRPVLTLPRATARI